MKMWSKAIFLMLAGAMPILATGQQNNSAPGGNKHPDAAFIRKNVRDNLNEIRMAELAISKDVDQDVKNVAILIRDDHNKMLNDLANYAKEANITEVIEPEMNISTDTTGHGNASSAGKGVLTRNRRDDAQSVDESRNTRKKNKATQQADAGKPSGDKRGTGFDHSRAKQATGDTGRAGGAGVTMEDVAKADSLHSQHMDRLQQASGTQFKQEWVSHMITMHEKKLGELQSAAQSLSDTEVKRQANAAIPKIKAHLEALQNLR